MKRTMNDTLNEKTKRPTDCHQIKSNTQNSLTISQSVICTKIARTTKRTGHTFTKRDEKKIYTWIECLLLLCFFWFTLIRSAFYSGQTGTFHCCQWYERKRMKKRKNKREWSMNKLNISSFSLLFRSEPNRTQREYDCVQKSVHYLNSFYY